MAGRQKEDAAQMTANAILIALAAAIAGYEPLGAAPLNPAVSQETITTTICIPGWTKTVRPSYAVSHAVKLEKLREAGLAPSDISRFELDHIVPLSLGGAPDDPGNMALQAWPEAMAKDAVEACLPRLVCAGRLTLAEAQTAIVSGWRLAGLRFGCFAD
jgi:hypothetical protein